MSTKCTLTDWIRQGHSPDGWSSSISFFPLISLEFFTSVLSVCLNSPISFGNPRGKQKSDSLILFEDQICAIFSVLLEKGNSTTLRRQSEHSACVTETIENSQLGKRTCGQNEKELQVFFSSETTATLGYTQFPALPFLIMC